jgi:SAM-dependent methyltransferase
MKKIMQQLHTAHYRFGAIGLLHLAVRRSRITLHNYLGSSRTSIPGDLEFDQLNNTDTSGRIALSGLKIVATDNKAICHLYQPTPVLPFARIVERLAVDCSKYTFVDYGCGKGRVLLLAAQYGFREIIGLDLSYQFCEIAQMNSNVYKKSKCADVNIRISCVDASTFQLPTGNCFLYLFNPFGEEIIQKVLENIEAALRIESRDVYIVYFNPQWRKVLDNAKFLTRHISSVWSPDWYIVYKAVALPK